jgi:hypothetical protein
VGPEYLGKVFRYDFCHVTSCKKDKKIPPAGARKYPGLPGVLLSATDRSGE